MHDRQPHEDSSNSSRRATIFPALLEWAIGAAILSTVFSCAHVEVVENVTRVPKEIQERISKPLGTLSYEAKCEYPKPTVLRCKLIEKDVCEKSQIEIVERTVVEERTTKTWVKVVEWLGAAIVLPIGVLVTVDASYIPDGSNPLDTNPVGQAGAYAIGGTLTAIGLGLAALAITDSVRAMDEIKEVGREEMVKATEPIACNEKPLARRDIAVRLQDREHTLGSDDQGMIHLDLEALAPAAEVLLRPEARSVSLLLGGKELGSLDLGPYVEHVLAAEAARKKAEEDKKLRLAVFHQEVDAVIAHGPSEECLAWYEMAVELNQKEARAVASERFAALRHCSASHLLQKATEGFKRGALDEGHALLARAESIQPENPDLGPAKEAALDGLRQAVISALATNRRQDAEMLLTRCPLFDPEGKVCLELAKEVGRAKVIETSAIGQLKKLRGLLLALPAPKVQKTMVDNLSKGLVVRSGSLADVEWAPAIEVERILPKDEEWLKQCFAEKDCTLGLLKQSGANLLVVFFVNPKGKRYEIEERLFVVAGCSMAMSSQVLDVAPPELQTRLWDLLRGQLTSGLQQVGTCSAPVKLAEVQAEPKAPDQSKSVTSEDERGPFKDVDFESLFATDEDCLAPTTCSPVLTDSPGANLPTEGGVFKRPRVLLLDLEVNGATGFNPSDPWLAKAGLKRTLMNSFRMKRNDYIVPCEAVTLKELMGKKLFGVDFVFQLALRSWKETTDQKSGKVSSVETELTLKIWDLRGGTWEVYAEADVAVPSWLDKGVFMAEDQKQQVIEQALNGTGLKEGIEFAADLAKKSAGGRVQPKLDDPKKNWYVYKLKQSLAMSGKKLGVEVAKLRDFRLSSPIVSREDDEVAVGVGEREGVRLCDTYLFSTKGPDDWEGFGRANHIGLGGAQGTADPSKIEVIADYESDASAITVFEYPIVGIVAGLSFGLMPVKHGPASFPSGDDVGERVLGMPGVALDVRWRIPWLPITEIYQTNRINYIIDPPVLLLTIDPGLEWRALWGRFAPVLGLRYSLGIAGVPVKTLGDEDATATGLAHGLEPYTGFYIFLHPAVTLSLHLGWRQYFSKISSFKKDGVPYKIDDGWNVDLSGPFTVLGVTYEY